MLWLSWPNGGLRLRIELLWGLLQLSLLLRSIWNTRIEVAVLHHVAAKEEIGVHAGALLRVALAHRGLTVDHSTGHAVELAGVGVGVGAGHAVEPRVSHGLSELVIDGC